MGHPVFEKNVHLGSVISIYRFCERQKQREKQQRRRRSEYSNLEPRSEGEGAVSEQRVPALLATRCV